jgi:anti-sigma B factor antagonist
MDLVTDTRTERGWTIISVTGELDLQSSPVLTDALAGALDRERPFVAVDLSSVGFMDSTALGVLVTAMKQAKERGGDIALVGAAGSPMKVLSLTGMADGMFTMADSVAGLSER